MDGLEERFRINLKEGLADALRERRDALESHQSQWHPEVLYLLLELSDQPTFKSRLIDLELLKEPPEDQAAQLRWEDIAREDGWDDDAAIWESINYSDGSGDEGYADSAKSEAADSSSSFDGYVSGRTAEDFIIHSEDIPQLNKARKAQEWRTEAPPRDASGHPRKIPVSEFQIVREVLFMIQGLNTTLFGKDGSVAPGFQMSHIAWDTHRATMNYFGEVGRQLGILRDFVSRTQNAAHLQVFQDSVATRLGSLDVAVTDIQHTLVAPEEDTVVSLLSVKGRLAAQLEPFYALSNIVAQIIDTPNLGAFRYLELLFDDASLAQLSGKPIVYEFLARIFVECFGVYLRQIRLWMDEGRLIPNDKMFFVSESPARVSLNKIWSDKYKLRRSASGKIHAPNFLHPAVGKIFNAGKNIVLLKQLGRSTLAGHHRKAQEPPLNYETICPFGFELVPFADLFSAAFDKWIESKYHTTSASLTSVLFDDCGVWSSLDALQKLYFMSDGAATDFFSNRLFSKLDALKPGWNNRYTLTSMAQEGFASQLDTTRLAVNISVDGQRLTTQTAQRSVRTALPTIRINFRLAWPVQMIITEESTATYQTVFTLLLQIRRALYVLRKKKLIENYWTDDENWPERALYYSLRTNLVWFCTTLQSYFTTLVLAPNSAKLREDLLEAQDADAMITTHAAFLKRVTDEACLGTRLQPIRECMLDILDLSIKLEQAQSWNAAQEAEEMMELSRLSVMSSPAKGKQWVAYKRGDNDDSDDDNEGQKVALDKPYLTVLHEVKSDFDRHLRFICGGLRSVARATGDAQSAKWDILAEMLQMGDSSRDERNEQ